MSRSVSLAAGAVARLGRWRGLASSWAVRAAWTALAAGLLSLTVHVVFGHRPGTPEALGVAPFVAVHPAYLGVVASALAGLGLARAGRFGSR